MSNLLRNVTLKTSIEMQRMRRSSRIIEILLREIKTLIAPGVTTRELNGYCEKLIARHHAVPSLKGYKGYPASICASANNIAVHGVPNDVPLRNNDIITVDVTLNVDGWHSDGAWTYIVGKPDAERLHLLRAAWRTLMAGILAVKAGGRLGDVGAAIERSAKRFGCSVLDDFAGHGIGMSLHEDPIVANAGKKGTGHPIVPGMVFTVEPILSLGSPEVIVMDDGWTVITKDGSLTAQFEHTVAVFRDRTEIMTYTCADIRNNIDLPPYF